MSNDVDVTTESGREIRERLMGTGDAPGDNDWARVRSYNDQWSDLNDLIDEVTWGRIYTRPGLSLRDRSLCVIVVHVTQRNWEHFRIHVGGAKRIGTTREELGEAIIQLLFYVGLPSVREGLRILDEVYGDDDIQPNPGAER